MNNLLARANASPEDAFPAQKTSYPTGTKVITTVALLVLGYYVLSLFDAWPSTVKRALHEFVVYLIPSPLIYAIQYGMVRLGRLTPEDAKFTRANFGGMQAKQEALRKLFGRPQLPLALGNVRGIPVVGSYISLSNDIGPPGLGNWDNSCYQNSILQGLASLPALLDYLEQSLRLCQRHNIASDTQQALVTLLEQLADTTSEKTVIWTPSVLKSMNSWQQQDAQEYFSTVLDAVEKESTACAKALKRSSHDGLEWLRTVATSGDGRMPDKPMPYQLPRNPLDGMTAQGLECKACGFTEGWSLTPFTCLTLNLGQRDAPTVQELLDEHTTAEEVDGVECENCTKLAHAKSERAGDTSSSSSSSEISEGQDGQQKTGKPKPVLRTKAKQITIGRLPKDLVLHINRSIFDDYGSQHKNTTAVKVPATLDFLSRWCAPLDENGEKMKDGDTVQAVYELKCVVTHYGRHDDGHYVALGKRLKDWYSFNDDVVTTIREADVLTRGNGFMIFYEAIQTPSQSEQESDVDPAGVESMETSEDETQDFTDAASSFVSQPDPLPVESSEAPVSEETTHDMDISPASTELSAPASELDSPITEPTEPQPSGESEEPLPAVETESKLATPTTE